MRSVLRSILLGMLLAWSAPGHAEDTIDLPRSAAEAYDAGEYERAADLYTALTFAMAAREADAWYNTGNACARAGRRGMAIAAYRTALDLAPGHLDAAANLAHLRAEVEEAPATALPSFLTWLVRPARRIPHVWWRRMTGLSWLLGWTAAAVGLWRIGPWRRTATIAAVVCAICAGGWGAHALARRLEPRAIVVTAVAPLRTGPGPDYLVTYELSDGAECFLLARQAGWVQLRVSDGGTGWTEAERVLTLPTGDPMPQRAPAPWEDAA